VAINDTATAQITTHNKPRKHKKCIQTKAHKHLNTRSQKKQVAIDTATHKPQHAKGPNYQYKTHTNTQWHTNKELPGNNDTKFRKLVLFPSSGENI
jgi:hypothetical protein